MDKVSKVPSRRGGDKTLSISKKKKAIKIKKTDKKGQPLEGVKFKMYANKEDALKDENILDLQTTDKDGIATFKHLPPYYGACIKESQTIENYQIRDKEKDIILVYRDNGVRFLGEIEPKNMKVTSINQNGKEKTLDSNKNVNQELQSLINGRGGSFNNNTNWLVYNDNGTEKLVAKKPLRYRAAWNSLYNAGLVFGQEGIDDLIKASFTYENFGYSPQLKDYGKDKETPKTYRPTYVTINNKKYLVRLMRGYNESIGIIETHDWEEYSDNYYNATKGSEWNRLILPLIDPTGDDNGTGYANGTNGRYGSGTKKFVENNMATLANYSWWTDFGGNNNSLGNYEKGKDCGRFRWTQDFVYGVLIAVRGSNILSGGAAYANYDYPDDDYNTYAGGWQPVLELVD